VKFVEDEPVDEEPVSRKPQVVDLLKDLRRHVKRNGLGNRKETQPRQATDIGRLFSSLDR
jgi:hypothetical protein